jgi:hypothetical protein
MPTAWSCWNFANFRLLISIGLIDRNLADSRRSTRAWCLEVFNGHNLTEKNAKARTAGSSESTV